VKSSRCPPGISGKNDLKQSRFATEWMLCFRSFLPEIEREALKRLLLCDLRGLRGDTRQQEELRMLHFQDRRERNKF